jgi:hypothetical protein
VDIVTELGPVVTDVMDGSLSTETTFSMSSFRFNVGVAIKDASAENLATELESWTNSDGTEIE